MATRELRVARVDGARGLLPLEGEYRPIHDLLCNGNDVVEVMIETIDGAWVLMFTAAFPDLVPYEDRNRAAKLGGGFNRSTPITISR